jgi:hypothetical protein
MIKFERMNGAHVQATSTVIKYKLIALMDTDT